jgi:hypothetical protein
MFKVFVEEVDNGNTGRDFVDPKQDFSFKPREGVGAS